VGAFCGPAISALNEWPEDLIDGDTFERFLPPIAESGGQVAALNPPDATGARPPDRVDYKSVDAAELAQLSARATQLLRF
jgi:hypothetical protein